VIEIALIQTSLTGERQKEFTALIRGTGYSGGARLVAIHHITDEMIKNERDFKDVWVEISPMIQNRTLVAHNAIFDQGMINRELERIGESPIGDFLCTLKLARFLGLAHRKSAQSEGASGNLGALAARLGLDVKPDHRALADTHALTAVFWKMNAMYPQKVAEYTKLRQRSRLITKSPVNFADHDNETLKSFHQGLDVVINPTLDAEIILDIQSLLLDVPDGDAFMIEIAKCDPTRKEFRDHQYLWFQRLNAYSKIAARAISHFWTTDGELIVALSENLPERYDNYVITPDYFSIEDTFARFDLDLLTGATMPDGTKHN
jgi:DNA polymerase III epsilon subunit-like protein